MKRFTPRKIIIEDPRLKKIRSNLRQVLKLSIFSELQRLGDLGNLYREKLIHNGSFLVPSQKRRMFSLAREHDSLYHKSRDSILECSSGAMCISLREMVNEGTLKPSERPININMVWVPHFKAWFCTRCYEKKYKIRICENCRKTNERMAKISNCLYCERYICEFCENLCDDCGELFCDQCYFEHLSKLSCV